MHQQQSETPSNLHELLMLAQQLAALGGPQVSAVAAVVTGLITLLQSQGRKPAVNRYELHVRVPGQWGFLGAFDVQGHGDGFQQAMLCLKPEHYDKEIRLEQVTKPSAAQLPPDEPTCGTP